MLKHTHKSIKIIATTVIIIITNYYELLWKSVGGAAEHNVHFGMFLESCNRVLRLNGFLEKMPILNFYFQTFSGYMYLNSGLGKVDLQRHLFSHKNVRVTSFGKKRFENVKLWARKCRSFPPLLSGCCCK